MAEPTAQEQYFLELVNRARLNPLAEAQRYGIDLNQGLAAGTLTATQKQPLAFNFLLNDSADSHSNWMLATDTFSHTGVNGSSPMQRMQTAGYSFTGSWWNGENIAYVGSTGSITIDGSIDSLHKNLFLSAGHRENILNGAFKEIGIGAQLGVFTSNGVNWNAVMATENFASSGASNFITGVVYNDSNGDKFYSIGEGVGGIVTTLKSAGTVLSSNSTWSAGGYTTPTTASGPLSLEFSGGSLASMAGVNFVGTGENAKIDLVSGNLIKASVSVQLIGAATGLELLGINGISGDGNELANTIRGNSGGNLLHGLGGNDYIVGLDGDDVIYGGTGADTLLGWTGNDTVYGGDGNDSMDGGAGIDTLRFDGATAAVTVNLVSGTATGEGSDTFMSFEYVALSSGSDVLLGDQYGNAVYGAGGNDYIYGGAAADWLQGDAGNDSLFGGTGNDNLLGGSGADSFLYRTYERWNADTIWDFQDGVDKLNFVGTGLGIGNFTITASGSDAIVTYNTNGDTIKLLGMAGLISGADFLF